MIMIVVEGSSLVATIAHMILLGWIYGPVVALFQHPFIYRIML